MDQINQLKEEMKSLTIIQLRSIQYKHNILRNYSSKSIMIDDFLLKIPIDELKEDISEFSKNTTKSMKTPKKQKTKRRIYKSGIYKIVNKRTSETYVGQTKNFKKRGEEHSKEIQMGTHHNPGIQEDFDNGDIFIMEIIEETEPNTQILHEKEMIWISRLNSFYEGYNQTPGGEYDKSLGNIGQGGGRLPSYKYEHYTPTNKTINLNLKEAPKENSFISKGRKSMKLANKHFYKENIRDNHTLEALKMFNKAIEINSNNEHAWFGRGEALFILREDKAAKDSFNKVLKINPNNDEAWVQKGVIWSFMSDDEQSIFCCNKAIEINPQNIEARKTKGQVLYVSKRYHEALRCFNEILEIDPNDVFALEEKGHIFYALGQISDGVKQFDKITKIKPRNSTALYWKADGLEKLGKYRDAIRTYEKAMQVDSRMSHLSYNISQLRQKLR